MHDIKPEGMSGAMAADIATLHQTVKLNMKTWPVKLYSINLADQYTTY